MSETLKVLFKDPICPAIHDFTSHRLRDGITAALAKATEVDADSIARVARDNLPGVNGPARRERIGRSLRLGCLGAIIRLLLEQLICAAVPDPSTGL